MPITVNNLSKVCLLTGTIVLLSACASSVVPNSNNPGLSGELSVTAKTVAMPDKWTTSLQQLESADNWLQNFNDPLLTKTVKEALTHNFQLKQQALLVDIKKRQLMNSTSQLWPELSASLSSSRRKSTTISSSSSLSLDARYEIDLWGKLSANEQKANLEWLSQQASFEQAQQQLVVNTVIAWYNAVSAEKQLLLNQQRSDNTQQNLAIIESGYKQGLNSSLDVYLTRNELNSALARVAQQQQNVLTAKRRLQSLLGVYPDAKILLSANLVNLSGAMLLQTPAKIIQRKPALRASWYQLLASDAQLAFTHKQRFPSFSLSASLSDDQQQLSDLLSGSSLAWSLLGNISAPIFQAGRLKNNEEVARLTLRQQEQNYLDTVFQTFSDIENGITAEISLQKQAQLQLQAGENAKAAYKLSFDQYQQGLVNYSTVLDAQNRWFDAQSSVIDIKNKLITNRVNLNLAIGSNFNDSLNTAEVELNPTVIED